LDALPATPRLAGIARALAADSTLIARALGRLRPRYDAMVLELPSSLSRLAVSALAAADGIVIPVTASVLGLHGLAGFRDWLASFPPDPNNTAPGMGRAAHPGRPGRAGADADPGGPRRAGCPRRLPGHWRAVAAGAGAPPGRCGRPRVPAAAAGGPGGPCRAGPRRGRRLRPAGRLPAGAGARSRGGHAVSAEH